MFHMVPMELLTPAAKSAAAFPRFVAWALGASSLASVLLSFVDFGIGSAARFAAGAVATVSACGLASWCEERAFLSSTRRRPLVRILLSLLMPFAGLIALGIMGSVSTAVLNRVGVSTIPGAAVSLGGIWFFSAALGSLCIVFVDLGVSALVPRFRSRIALSAFALLGLVVSVFLVGEALVRGFVAGAVARGEVFLTEDYNLVIGTTPPRDSIRVSVDAADDAASIVLLLGALFALPAVLSACNKLADAIMERLHPLSLGFSAVAEGRLDVFVEEAGSVDFIALNRGFNRMVSQLGTAQRMERAFGAYLNQQLLGRIKAQHGDGALPASQRVATVFFADIRGFTSLSEKLPPDRVLDILNRYFERVIAVIDAHEGFLNKFIGDAVVVVFNGPIDQDDHPERAVRCAIAIQREVDAMNRAGAFPEIGSIQVGVGVATGPLVAGNLGSARQMEYTVIGDTVNLAARLTSKAPAGEVWINEAAAAALPRDVGVAPLTPLHVKGRETPVKPSRAWPPAGAPGGTAGPTV